MIRVYFTVLFALLLPFSEMDELIIHCQLFMMQEYADSPGCGAAKVSVQSQVCLLIAFHSLENKQRYVYITGRYDTLRTLYH